MTLHRLSLTALLAAAPAAAGAETMPQMDFHNPLTGAQVIWMVVILLVLYFALARWALPQMGAVLADRAAVIKRDLDAARAAKAAADAAVKELDATMRQARAKAQAEIAETVADAKAKAAAEARRTAARLDAQLAESEAQIAAAREQAMAAIKPVAKEAAAELVLQLAKRPATPDAVERQVSAAMAARQAA
jgi:F-type H+-transporting ATPase subunit b